MNETNKDNIESLLTLKEASTLLSCHPNTLREWDKSGYLKAIRIGQRGDRRYKKSDIQKLMGKTK
ncbi:helix-turn-helix domain-containing protein [Candidatus Saccharibacteria bacterium]|jgi:excisionase family DNA binding protein|nr:helix-turn-helix domain-containing protein [Candidatus Saccharibacteria bacterium]